MNGEMNSLFVKARIKWKIDVGVAADPTVANLFQNKAVSGFMDEKTIKSPKAHIPSEKLNIV